MSCKKHTHSGKYGKNYSLRAMQQYIIKEIKVHKAIQNLIEQWK